MRTKSKRPIESLPSNGILIKILTTNKQPPKSFNNSPKPTKSYPIKTKGKPTISMAMMALSHLEVRAIQRSEDLILTSIMLKTFSDTFLRKILSMMTFSKGFSATKSKRRKIHRDLVAEGLVLLIAILFFPME
jgi:hypothetical protein